MVREPESDVLALKRVFGRPGDVVHDVHVTDPDTGQQVGVTIRLGLDEAWLVGDDPAVSIDSRRYGPVSLDRLVSHIVIHEVGHHFGFSDDDMHALEDSAE